MALGPSYRKLFAASTVSNLGDGVSIIAYPWLASAITRNPLLIALVAVAQRLPWLVFALPAGVITDRQRPPPADGRRQRAARDPDRRRRRRRLRPARRAAGARRGRPGRRRPSGCSTSSCSSPPCCSAWARCSTTTAPRRSCRRIVEPERARAGQRPAVLGRAGGQPVRRPAARQPAARRQLRPALRGRRRLVRGLRRARVQHRRHAAVESRDRADRDDRGARRRPRASAGCGTTSCSARWPSRSACSTCSAASAWR